MKPILFVCLWLAALGLRAEQEIVVLQVQTNASSMELSLTVLGETDSDTQRLGGFVRLAVDCSNPLAAASLRDFRVQAVTNFNLSVTFGLLGGITGTLSALEIEHGDPGPHQPYEPVVDGILTFHGVPNKLDGSVHYQATGFPCSLLQNASRPCTDTLPLANQPSSPIGELSGTLTLTNGILRFVGGFDFGPVTLVEGATLSGVGTIAARGIAQPCLRIERAANEHRVIYSSAFRDFRLARTGSLSTPVTWQAAVPDAVLDNGTNVTATFTTAPDGMAFYRLDFDR